jgi:hypothetical protein
MQGWRQGRDGRVAKLCVSRTRGSALRVIQALVLAGADASGIVKALEEGSDAEELRFVIAATNWQLCVAQPIMWQHQSALPLSGSAPAADCLPCAVAVSLAACREVVERLRRPVWMQGQHRLWPRPFKAAVQMLLICLRRCQPAAPRSGAGGSAGGRAGGRGDEMEVEGVAAAAAVPDKAVLATVGYLGQAWWA